MIGFINGMSMPLMTAIPLEHPAMGPALAGTVTGLMGMISSFGGLAGQLSYTWMLEIFGARTALITMRIIGTMTTVFVLPLSETGTKGKRRDSNNT